MAVAVVPSPCGPRHAGQLLTATAGNTPLINAVMAGESKIVRYLLDRGADVNLPAGPAGKKGNSPLIQAVMSGKLEVVRMLVEAGADLDYSHRDFKGGALAAAKEMR